MMMWLTRGTNRTLPLDLWSDKPVWDPKRDLWISVTEKCVRVTVVSPVDSVVLFGVRLDVGQSAELKIVGVVE